MKEIKLGQLLAGIRSNNSVYVRGQRVTIDAHLPPSHAVSFRRIGRLVRA
jgi:hypothetical protein